MGHLLNFGHFSFRDEAHLRDPARLRRLRPIKGIARAAALAFGLFGLGTIALGIHLLPSDLRPPHAGISHWVEVFSYGMFILVGAGFVHFSLSLLRGMKRTLLDEHLAGAGDCLFAQGALTRIVARRKTEEDQYTLTAEGTFGDSGTFSEEFDETLWTAGIADPANPRPGDDKRVKLPIPCCVLYRSSAPERGELAGIPEKIVAQIAQAAEESD
ncbi:MAG: hypothetical protein ACYC2I_01660 [Elusimicrobiales bacterium]